MAEIYGHEIAELPDGWIATSVLVLVKCYAPDAPAEDIPIRVSTRGSENLSMVDALGMVHAAKVDIEDQYRGTLRDG